MLFSDCHVIHLPQSRSKHHPLLVHDREARRVLKPQTPFWVQAVWFLDPRFKCFLTQCWTEDGREELLPKLNFLRESLEQWNKVIFGNIFDRKFRCLAILSSIQRKMRREQSERLIALEEQLRWELNMILEQEDIFWLQKS